jgi:hypothetical protein
VKWAPVHRFDHATAQVERDRVKWAPVHRFDHATAQVERDQVKWELVLF